MNDDEQEVDVITRNILQKNKILGVYKRNWIEACVLGVAGFFAIKKFNFVNDIELVLSVMAFVSLFYLGIVGIQGRSITQILFAELKFRKRRRKLHLRSAEYVRKKNTEKDSVYEEKSIAEQLAFTIRTKLNKFIDTYSKGSTGNKTE